MNHQFSSTPDNKSQCAICSRDFLSHTAAAKCERCGKNKECNVYNGILSCWECHDRYLHGIIEKASQSDEAKKVIADARRIDTSIRFNGDVFNALTISHIELRKAYLDNEEIPENQREHAFQRHLIERYEWLKTHVFKLQDEQEQLRQQQSDAYTEQKAISKTLREIGNDLREDIRAKLKEHDHNYKPVAVVKPKLVTVRGKNKDKTRTDVLVEQIMLFHGVDRKTALDKVLELQKKKDKENAMDKVVSSYMEMHPELTKEQALESIRKGSNQ